MEKNDVCRLLVGLWTWTMLGIVLFLFVYDVGF